MGLKQVVSDCTAALERLDFSAAGRRAYDFLWNHFADWYVEAAKTRLYADDAVAAGAARQVSTLVCTQPQVPALIVCLQVHTGRQLQSPTAASSCCMVVQ